MTVFRAQSKVPILKHKNQIKPPKTKTDNIENSKMITQVLGSFTGRWFWHSLKSNLRIIRTKNHS